MNFFKKKNSGDKVEITNEEVFYEIKELRNYIENQLFYYLDRINATETENKKLKEERITLLNTNKEHQRLLELKDKNIAELTEKVKSLNGAKGGLTKENNKLESEIKELKYQNELLEKSQEDLGVTINTLLAENERLKQENKTLRIEGVKAKKVRRTMPPKLEMQIKDNSKNSRIIKKAVEVNG